MNKARHLFFVFMASIAVCASQDEQDTASVTYNTGLGVYLLEYNLSGITYVDTLEPATKIDPVVSCQVTFDSMYTYSYVASLLSSSQQYLLSFRLFFSANVEQQQKPSARWDIFLGQNNIDWANTNIDTTGLHTDTTDIGPGGALSGFSFRSSGLPTIVNAYFKGNTRGLAFTEEPPVKMEHLLAPILAFPNNTVVCRSLGPTNPPSPFVALDFIDTLIAMKNEAKSLNWIQEGDLSDLIDTRLSKARDHLESEDESGALEDLQAALSAVEHDCLGMGAGPGVSYLTSEACALLRYNLQYLIDQL